MPRRNKCFAKDVKSKGAGNSAPGPAVCIYRGPSAGNNSKEERGRFAERIQHVPASPSEKDPATTFRRSKRIVPAVRYCEDESGDQLSSFLELQCAQIAVRPSKSPGKRLKRASGSNNEASSSALVQRGAIGAPASPLKEEPSDDLEIAWNDYESDSADSWKAQEFVTLSFKELSEKQAK